MQEDLYIDFDNYLNNEMTLAEREVFEKKLENNIVFSETFQLYKETNAFVSHKFSLERKDFKDNIKSIAKDNLTAEKPKKSKVINLRTTFYAIAAVLVMFIGITFFQNNTPEYSDFNQHENASFTERGDVLKNLKLAQDAFNNKNYKEAIVNFEIVLKEYPRPEVKYFYAISLLEDNQFAKSELVLTEIIYGKSLYKNTATWYLALSKLKQKQYKLSQDILESIPKDYEDYDQVLDLLEQLKKVT